MSITLTALMKQRYDTAANWTTANPTLLAGEIGIESDTKKWKLGDGSTAWTSLGYIPGLSISAYPLVNADIAAGAEIAVSKLADGTPRQLLQTDAAGTGVEWASNIDIPGTLDVTGAATFDNNVIIQGDLTVNGTTTTIDTTNLAIEDKNIEIGKVTTPSDVTADGGGITLKATVDKTITWIDATDAWTFSEHVNIVSAKEYRIAGTKVLDATSLGSAVVSSSLTSVGTIGTGVWQGTAITDTYLATIATAGKVSNSATTATDANTASAIVARDASGNFTAGTITAALTGAASSNVLKAGDTMTGALVHPLGAAATPSLTFTGDLNTGIFSPGADQVAISTNGTERMRLDSSGRLGLGTSSPQALLHLSSSTITESRYTATGTGGRTWRIGTGDNVSGLSGAFRIYDETGAATRLYITNAGQVGIGTTSPDALLTVNGIGAFGAGAVTTPSIAATGDLNTGFWFPAADTIAASTAGSERARIDSSGRLLVGTSTKVGSTEKKLEVLNGTIGLANFTATASGASLLFEKGRGTSVGTIVQANDDLGSFLFRADDGVDSFTTAAQISAAVDGTPGANDMPGRLVFSVTADGASSPTEALRISNNRAITVSDGGNVVLGTTTGTKIGTATTQKIGFYNATPVVQPAAVANATTAVDVITQLNDLLAKLRTLGIIAT